MFWKSLVEFLCADFLIEFLHTDVDGKLSFTWNPLTASKLDHFLSTLPEGLSETANEDEVLDQHVWNEHEKSKHRLIDEIVDIALSATQIPLSIFTNLFHKRFEKHSMLESTLEILQQFYIQMEAEPHDFLLCPGDSSLYTLRCMRCHQPVTLYGSTRQTLLHAPTAMLHHWNMSQFHDEQNHREPMLTLLLFTSYDTYLLSLKSFQVSLNWIKKFGFQKPTKYGEFMFYEAIMNDMANSKETSFNNTISSTLSLITVLFEDLFGAVSIQAVLCGEKEDPIPSITSLNKTNTCDGYDFNIYIINNDEYNTVQNELLMMFEGFCIFGF
jgi:hypothetical protein